MLDRKNNILVWDNIERLIFRSLFLVAVYYVLMKKEVVEKNSHYKFYFFLYYV